MKDAVNPGVMGRVAKATISKESTLLLEGLGTKEAIDDRCESIRDLIETVTSNYEKDKLKERLAKLSAGVAVIKVGGSSEVVVNEKKDRITDALNATRAAVEVIKLRALFSHSVSPVLEVFQFRNGLLSKFSLKILIT